MKKFWILIKLYMILSYCQQNISGSELSSNALNISEKQ